MHLFTKKLIKALRLLDLRCEAVNSPVKTSNPTELKSN